MRAQQIDVLVHQVRIGHLVIGHREVSVPEEGQLFQQLTFGLDHAVQPPRLDILDVLEVKEVALKAGEKLVKVFVDELRVEELLEGGFPTELLVSLHSGGGG